MFTFIPELLRSARVNDEERLAILVHEHYGRGEPLKTRQEYEGLLAKAGIVLCYDSNLEDYGALFFKDENEFSPIISIRRDLRWLEQRFLIASLLGRVCLDYQLKAFFDHLRTGLRREVQSPYQRYLLCKRPRYYQLALEPSRTDWLCEEFAGAFLIPKLWLQKFTEQERDPSRIASHFDVPIECLHARVRHIRQKSFLNKDYNFPKYGPEAYLYKKHFASKFPNPQSKRRRETFTS